MADSELLGAARRAVFEDFRRDQTRRWIRVDGGSMRPLITPGTWLSVDFGPVRPRVGMVVLAALRDEMAVHRVIRVHGERVLLKGDAEVRADPIITTREIFGVVRAIRRSGGRATAIGCAGSAARLIAAVSRAAGRGVTVAHRAAAHMPRSMRAVVLPPVNAMARLPVHALVALVALVGQSVDSRIERG